MSVTSTTMMSTRARAMTEAASANQDSLTPKASLVQGSTRPHSTPGKGKTHGRLEREAAARRAVFAVSLAGFVGLFGLIASLGKPAPAVNAGLEAQVSDVTGGNRVLAEVPITGLNGGD